MSSLGCKEGRGHFWPWSSTAKAQLAPGTLQACQAASYTPTGCESSSTPHQQGFLFVSDLGAHTECLSPESVSLASLHHVKTCCCPVSALGLSEDRAAVLASGSEAMKPLAGRREGGTHGQAAVGGTALHWRDDRNEVRAAAELCGEAGEGGRGRAACPRRRRVFAHQQHCSSFIYLYSWLLSVPCTEDENGAY